MALGERAEFVVPPNYAYGEAGIAFDEETVVIPPNETLTFMVELCDFGRPTADEDEEEEGDFVDVEEAEEEEEKDPIPFWEQDPDKEGGVGPGYTWEASGTGKEILVKVPLKDDVKVNQVKVDVRTFSLSCKIENETIIDGKPFADVQMDDSHWDLEKVGKSSVQLVITLAKLDQRKRWESVLEGGAEAEAEAAAAARTARMNAALKAKAAEEAAEAPPQVDVIDIDEALRVANASVRRSTEANLKD
eukprot:TRINITY_DN42410_c0_g1_i1.p1 TRINITY_DN42410_c0_g1~~TRINITY_DN42410_c0_g1_i1.p1  ORF type:complete len:270 (+),score=73.39 TRINITY_DN42410_c0_g1_i1:71-811(+)